MLTNKGIATTRAIPVLHKPIEDIGGGSAFAAGFLDAFADAQDPYCLKALQGHTMNLITLAKP